MTKELAPQNTEISPVIAAIQNGNMDVETIGKLLEYQERWEERESKKLFILAMAETQKEMPVIFEGRRNKQTGSTYSAYKDIVRYSKPVYTKHGLSVSFYEEDGKEGYVNLCADVYHDSGFTKKYTANIPIDDKGPKGSAVKTRTHGVKSAISYGRGILLCNIFNIPTSADIDDDGNGAGDVVYINDRQISELTDMINAYNVDESKFLAFMRVKSLDMIELKNFEYATTNLQKKAK